jgi:hypothetical protein
MTDIRKLAPGEGRLVRHPDGDLRYLLKEGEYVEMNSYWRRRLNVGDVVQLDPIPISAQPQAEKSAPKGGAK